MNDVKRYDEVLKIGLSFEDEAKLPNIENGEPVEVYRSRATRTLKDLFDKDCWTLRESRSGGSIELRVSIRTERAEEFRAKIKELGFTEVKSDEAETTNENAGRSS